MQLLLMLIEKPWVSSMIDRRKANLWFNLDLNRRDHRAWYGLGETYEIIKMYNYALYYFKEAFALK